MSKLAYNKSKYTIRILTLILLGRASFVWRERENVCAYISRLIRLINYESNLYLYRFWWYIATWWWKAPATLAHHISNSDNSWKLSTSPKHLATIALLQHLFHQGHLHYYASHINQYASWMFLIVACPLHTHTRELQYVDKGRCVHMPHGCRHASTAVGHRCQILKMHRITYHALPCPMGYRYPTFYARDITLST